MIMTKFKTVALTVLLAAFTGVEAQTLRLKGECKTDNVEGMQLVCSPMGATDQNATVKLTASGKKFEGEIKASPTGFYYIFGNNNGGQLVIPLYWPDVNKECKLKLSIDNGQPMVKLDKDNEAFSAYGVFIYDNSLKFWNNGKDMTDAELKAMFSGFITAADSISKAYKCSDAAKQYLNLWAYTTAYQNFDGIQYATGKNPAELPFAASDVLGEAFKMLDSPLAASLSSTYYIAWKTLPAGSVDAQLAYLQSNYKSEKIRKNAGALVLDEFISKVDFEGGNYAAAETELAAVIQKYGFGNAYMEKFEKRKASVSGSPFPANVKLVDAQGNTVDFASFRGSYVYVDLWASWCGPCCAEVPHLQKLEKELENPNVKFVSISLDKDEAAWKKKMEALDMHGNQLHNADNSLADALGVRGIPFFVIYDKNGRLYKSNAPRPSDPSLKPLLEGLK